MEEKKKGKTKTNANFKAISFEASWKLPVYTILRKFTECKPLNPTE